MVLSTSVTECWVSTGWCDTIPTDLIGSTVSTDCRGLTVDTLTTGVNVSTVLTTVGTACTACCTGDEVFTDLTDSRMCTRSEDGNVSTGVYVRAGCTGVKVPTEDIDWIGDSVWKGSDETEGNA